MMKSLFLTLLILPNILLGGCTSIDRKFAVVDDFSAQQYLGKWYEIARLDHSFEKDLTNVTAEYSKEDDCIKVINRGYDPVSKQWQSANGTAYFMENENVGRLRVSFFWPFYGAYQIHELLPEKLEPADRYQVSLVLGPNTQYMWILARTPQIDEKIKRHLVQQAQTLGVDTDTIIWVDQSPK